MSSYRKQNYSIPNTPLGESFRALVESGCMENYRFQIQELKKAAHDFFRGMNILDHGWVHRNGKVRWIRNFGERKGVDRNYACPAFCIPLNDAIGGSWYSIEMYVLGVDSRCCGSKPIVGLRLRFDYDSPWITTDPLEPLEFISMVEELCDYTLQGDKVVRGFTDWTCATLPGSIEPGIYAASRRVSDEELGVAGDRVDFAGLLNGLSQGDTWANTLSGASTPEPVKPTIPDINIEDAYPKYQLFRETSEETLIKELENTPAKSVQSGFDLHREMVALSLVRANVTREADSIFDPIDKVLKKDIEDWALTGKRHFEEPRYHYEQCPETGKLVRREGPDPLELLYPHVIDPIVLNPNADTRRALQDAESQTPRQFNATLTDVFGYTRADSKYVSHDEVRAELANYKLGETLPDWLLAECKRVPGTAALVQALINGKEKEDGDND